jgi:hypothetical protein
LGYTLDVSSTQVWGRNEQNWGLAVDQKVIAGMFAAAVMAMMTWVANTTLELKMSVQRLEIILLDEAMTK